MNIRLLRSPELNETYEVLGILLQQFVDLSILNVSKILSYNSVGEEENLEADFGNFSRR
jgi:hypothetical protein